MIDEIINDLQRIADRICYPEDILDGSIAQEWIDYLTDLQQENKQLKEKLEDKIDLYEDTISYQLGYDSAKALYEKILTELEEWLKEELAHEEYGRAYKNCLKISLDKIQKLKEKYK